MAKHIIVGVDPGTTCGVAALGLDGGFVGAKSSKDMGLPQTVEYIISLGWPSLIASDVNPPPAFVSSVASKFGVTLHVPQKSLQVSEKLDLARPYGLSDAHQRDALAAAASAYSAYKMLLQKADSQGLTDDMKHLVLQGKSLSLAKAPIEDMRRPQGEAQGADDRASEKVISPQEQTIRELQKRVKALQGLAVEKDVEIAALREGLASAKRVTHTRAESKTAHERQVTSLNHRIHALKEHEKLLRRASSGEISLVGVWPQVSGGLTLIEVKPERLQGVRAAFSSKNKIREFIAEQGVEAYDAGELSHLGDCHYISVRRLRELAQTKRLDIEGLVSEYRHSR
jgi:uncharacterized protein